MVVSSGPQTIDFKAVFEASPNPYLLLDRDLTIVGMNKSFLRATMKRRKDILGRNLFAVFPSNPSDPAGSDLLKAHRSFERVLNERMADAMGVMRYDLRRPGVDGGCSRSGTGAESIRRSLEGAARSPPSFSTSSTPPNS